MPGSPSTGRTWTCPVVAQLRVLRDYAEKYRLWTNLERRFFVLQVWSKMHLNAGMFILKEDSVNGGAIMSHEGGSTA